MTETVCTPALRPVGAKDQLPFAATGAVAAAVVEPSMYSETVVPVVAFGTVPDTAGVVPPPVDEMTGVSIATWSCQPGCFCVRLSDEPPSG